MICKKLQKNWRVFFEFEGNFKELEKLNETLKKIRDLKGFWGVLNDFKITEWFWRNF